MRMYQDVIPLDNWKAHNLKRDLTVIQEAVILQMQSSVNFHQILLLPSMN
jgi:hypothetical protein